MVLQELCPEPLHIRRVFLFFSRHLLFRGGLRDRVRHAGPGGAQVQGVPEEPLQAVGAAVSGT